MTPVTLVGRCFRALVVLLSLNAATILWYYNNVDVVWMIDLTLPEAGQQLTAEQREATIEAVSNISPLTLGALAATQLVLILLVWFFAVALYLRVVSAIRRHGFKLKQWFSLVVWCSFPLALTMLASLASMLAADIEFLRPDRINPLSFATLLDIDGLGGSIANHITTTADLGAIWAATLMVLGYRNWTASNWLQSVAVALGPVALIVTLLYIFAA